MKIKHDNLEDHIDDPIKRAVALMNLYGVPTIFSCCGFDYKDEKVNKSHVSGQPQIMFKVTRDSMWKIANLVHTNKFAMNNSWVAYIVPTRDREPYTKGFIGCRIVQTTPNWNDKNSPHFHEGCNSAITILEERLLDFKDEMKDKVVVRDYNEVMKKVYPHWQYDPCKPWIIHKKDFV